MQRRDFLKVAGLADPSGEDAVVKPQQRPRYSLEELLAQCRSNAPRSKQDREWLSEKPAGAELI